MTLLEVKHLSKFYDENPAVRDVSFRLGEGRCIALIGPNGAGKTTILRTLAGLLKPAEGTVTLTGLKPYSDRRAHIGYLPQHPVFYPWMTGMEFLQYSGRLSFLSKKQASERAEDLLNIVGISKVKSKRIGKYSGGMRQRLGIAQAMMHKPELLILDEPVSALDPIGRRDILTLMEKLKQELTILFSTHILSDADEVSDELLLLHEGRLVESGPMDVLRQKFQTEKLELTFTGDVRTYQKRLNTLETVRDTIVTAKHVLEVQAGDVQQARQDILRIALDENWSLTGFTTKPVTLEDMFMKAVK